MSMTSSLLSNPYKPTKAGIAALQNHDKLVGAVQEAITALEAPFGPNDYIPSTIEDAIEILRSALGLPQRERQDG
jgi:hypothetical protein